MTEITYRDWMFDCDVGATRKAYETISAGGVETCECSGCKNFLAQRDSAFPAEIMKLFDEMGVNYKRDAEIYHITRLQPRLHQYGGWFHFVGNILKQPVGPANLDHFTVDFVSDNALAAKAFENQPLVQIEITAEIPWVLTENEID
jgi:hypothetical protein